MEQQLIIARRNGQIVSALYEGKRLVQVMADPAESEEQVKVGEIYLGRVKNIVKNINAAFVEIAAGVMCYLALDGVMTPLTRTQHADGKIHAGDELIVQVEREPIKTKLAAVSCNLNLTGKYAVLVHGKPVLGISGKITDASARQRLKDMFSSAVSDEYGFIVRTNATEATPEEIQTELLQLQRRYEKLQSQGLYRSCFSVLERPLPAYLCNIRDTRTTMLSQILTDDESLYQEMKEYLLEYQPQDAQKLLYHESELPLLTLFSFESRLGEALNKKVWLKSGASLVIEPTEALTVIDVNTGKAVNSRKQGEEHFLAVNLEAAKEIAHQIRLRNLSGIILIDFIDMEKEESNQVLLKTLQEYLQQDPVKTILVDMTPLHLVELTRKKVRKPLHEMEWETQEEHGKVW